MKRQLLRLFLKLATNRFLLQEIRDHEHMIENHLLMDWDDEREVRVYLDDYLFPEKERRGL